MNLHVLVVVITLVSSTQAVFRRTDAVVRRYSCHSNWDCPSHRCLTKINHFCVAKDIFRWLLNKASCYYRVCAQCTADIDCGTNQTCSSFKCKDIKMEEDDEEEEEDECRFHINCKNFERCHKGKCKARRCDEDRRCPANRECRRFKCTKRRSKDA